MSLLGKWISGIFGAESDGSDPLKALDDKVYLTRQQFESMVRAAAERDGDEDPSAVAKSVGGYVFDFGDFDFDMHTTRGVRAAVEKRVRHAFLDVSVAPEALTACMIHRAWRQGRPAEQLIAHLQILWGLALAVIGPRAAPSGQGLFTVHKDLYTAVCAVVLEDMDVARYLTSRSAALAEQGLLHGGTEERTPHEPADEAPTAEPAPAADPARPAA